jgi:hypothetical protein
MPPLNLIFLLLFLHSFIPPNDAQSTKNSSLLNQKSESRKVRNRRSNFPCGHSFVPCAQEEEKEGNELEGEGF